MRNFCCATKVPQQKSPVSSALIIKIVKLKQDCLSFKGRPLACVFSYICMTLTMTCNLDTLKMYLQMYLHTKNDVSRSRLSEVSMNRTSDTRSDMTKSYHAAFAWVIITILFCVTRDIVLFTTLCWSPKKHLTGLNILHFCALMSRCLLPIAI